MYSFLERIKTDGIYWSDIAAIGNTPIAKLTPFLSIIAQYVYLSRGYLDSTFGLSNAVWLYWSIVFFSAGQIVYFVGAPGPIKKFAADIDSYKSVALQTWPHTQFERSYRSYFLSHFSNNGGQLPFREAVYQETQDDFRDQMRNQVEARIRNLDRSRSVAHFVTDLYFNVGLNPSLDRIYNVEELKIGLECASGQEIPDQLETELRKLFRILRLHPGDTQWKVEALEWLFGNYQKAKRPLIYLALALYALGSLYFLWSIARGLFNMSFGLMW